jgi:DNA modification methylase
MVNQVILADCCDILPQIQKESIDLILIDPPYLISRDSNFKKFSDTYVQQLKIDDFPYSGPF